MSERHLLPKPPRTKQYRVYLDASAAQLVVVTGDFCGWTVEGRPLTRNRRGIWQASLLLPSGRYEYRFLVDGQWRDDPSCHERVPNPFGSDNCVLRVRSMNSIKGKHMTKKTLDGYRKALSALATRLESNLAHDQRELMRADEPDVAGGPIRSTDVIDGGVAEVEVGMIHNEERLLAEVAEGLKRIEAGTFGQCATCGKAIARSRLDAVPYARDCIRCARATKVAVSG